MHLEGQTFALTSATPLLNHTAAPFDFRLNAPGASPDHCRNAWLNDASDA